MQSASKETMVAFNLKSVPLLEVIDKEAFIILSV
jgi:hypothetical protein